MDVGTAKPTREERARVRHHLIDVADPGERYDVARYQREARAVLADLAGRGIRAIVVGGTGLYVCALLDGLDLAALPVDEEVRRRLERDARDEGAEAMHGRLAAVDPEAAARVDPRNIRRVIRYLEIATIAGSASDRWDRAEPILARRIGLLPPRPWLARRIDERVHRMVADGVLDETRELLERGLDPSLPSLTAHGYVHWARHLRGGIDLEAAIAATVRDTRAYAKRQMTWFRRDPEVRWVDPTTDDPFLLIAEAA